VVAVASDLIWLCALTVPLVLNIFLTPVAALLTWLGGAIAAAMIAMYFLRMMPSLPGGWRLLRQRHPVAESTALGTLMGTAATFVVLAVAGIALSREAAGALRGAATLMAPLNTLLAYTTATLTSAAYRRGTHFERYCLKVSLGLGAAAATWGIVLGLAPSELGTMALGDTWSFTDAILPYTSVEYLGLCIAAGATLALRVGGWARSLLWHKGLYALTVCSATLPLSLSQAPTVGYAMTLAGCAFGSVLLGWGMVAHRTKRSRRALEVVPNTLKGDASDDAADSARGLS
jgi:hypothetical protein